MTVFELTSSSSASRSKYYASGNSQKGSDDAGAFTTFMGLPDEASAEKSGATSDREPIFVAGLTPVRLSDLIEQNPSLERRFAELPEDEYRAYIEEQIATVEQMSRSLELSHSTPVVPDPANYPALSAYGSVVLNGEVVATADNQGVLRMSSDLSEQLRLLLPNNVNGASGPDLAQARLEIVAKILDGKIVIADTALSQQQFRSLPEYRQEWITDYAAMLNDPIHEEIVRAQANLREVQKQRAEYLAT